MSMLKPTSPDELGKHFDAHFPKFVPHTKRVVAVFDVEVKEQGTWTASDIALHIETCTKTNTWHNATVYDSLADLKLDLAEGLEP